jgi:membrane protease YdiL (CAAX protease family)
MTAASFSIVARLGAASGWVVPVALVAGLGAIVGGRAIAVRAGLDPLLVGAAFGVALLALALAGRAHRIRAVPAISLARPIAIGVLVGLGLVAVAILGPAIGGVLTASGLGRPAAPFLPWALVTLLVAAAEEGVLRGALFDRIGRLAGLGPAIVVTALAFALMHVPLYGWHVVPLDVAVGLVLAGLRIWTRGLAAPIAAHAVADLATWWL